MKRGLMNRSIAIITSVTLGIAMLLNGQVNIIAQAEEQPFMGEGYEKTATPLDAEFIESSDMPATGYIDIDLRAELYDSVESYMLQNSSIPSSYDSRNVNGTSYITETKDQNPYGTCWAFSAVSAAETSMLKRGFAVGTPDYSEYQLAYFMYNHVDDPLGTMNGDSIKLSSANNYLQMGGNNYWTMFGLTSWIGLGNESLAPYGKASPSSTLDSSVAYQDVAHLQNTYIVSMENAEEVKNLIMQYGSVVSSLYMVTTSDYFNRKNAALYCPDNKGTNHAITVIGWDDNYAASNFGNSYLEDDSQKIRPSSDGAWLIKNSWGDYVSYFWVSYEDYSISHQDAFAYVYEKADNYDYNYQYDGAFSAATLYVYNGSTLANVFTASGAEKEKIKAVSIALADDNVEYSIQIYKNPEEGNPLSGTPLLQTPVSGQTTYEGYYTIPLNQEVTINKGDIFSVAFTLTDLEDENESSTGTVRTFVDMSQTTSNYVVTSHTEKNQSYICVGNSILDCNEKFSDGICPKIKAFTVKGTGDTGGEVEPEKPVTEYNGVDYQAVYDYDYYIEHNAEIAEKFSGDAQKVLEYFVNYGMQEGQQGCAEFDVNAYACLNADLRRKYKNDLPAYYMDYIKTGKSAGKKALGASTPQGGSTVCNGVNYSAVYDFGYYYNKYADLRTAYGYDDDAYLQHFIYCGMYEGRQASEYFNVRNYAYMYGDLRRAFKNNLSLYYLHYMNFGKREGRAGTGIVTTLQGGSTVYNGIDYGSVYDLGYYYNRYADLQNAYGFDDDAYLQHFIYCGMYEGRQANDKFNVRTYAYMYGDLRHAYKNNLNLYYMHYMYFGKSEGRVATGVITNLQGGTTVYNGIDYGSVYDLSYYYTHNVDLQSAFGFDDDAYLRHFLYFGMREGRQGKTSFNVYKYKANYMDLQNAYGQDLKSYYMHYIYFGLQEGRSAE